MGMILSGADEYGRAAQWEEKALQMDPDENAYARNLAISYNALGDYARAEQLYEKALSGDGINNSAFLDSAIRFHHRRGNKDRVDELLPLLEEADPVKAAMFRLVRET